MDWPSIAPKVAAIILGEPNARLSNAKELRFGSKGSVRLDLGKGTWHDFEADEGGGIAELIKLRGGGVSVADFLRDHGIDGVMRPAPRRRSRSVSRTDYEYHSPDGELVGRVRRTDGGDGHRFYQERREGGRWRKGAWPDPRPYLVQHLGKVPADREVWVVEGEKCALALSRRIRAPALTWRGGAASWAKTEWADLRGRKVRLWPDADDAGRKAMAELGRHLAGLECEVSVVVPPDGVARGWDAADWVETDAPLPEIVPLAAFAGGGEVALKPFASLQMRDWSWAWEGYLLRESLNLISGRPGVGKSTMAAMIAAHITTGRDWPDGSPARKGRVIWWTGEEDHARAILPRLIAAGADLGQVFMPPAGFRPEDSLSYIEFLAPLVGEGDVVILDPVINVALQAQDSHRATDIRKSVQPVLDLCTQSGCGVVGIAHNRKSVSGRTALEQVQGSGAWGAAARSVLAIARMRTEEASDDQRFLMAQAKASYAVRERGGWEYEIETAEAAQEGNPLRVRTSRVAGFTWRAGDPDDLVVGEGDDAQDATDAERAVADAVDFLRERVHPKSEGVSWKTLTEEAKEGRGITPAQLNKGRRKLGWRSEVISGVRIILPRREARGDAHEPEPPPDYEPDLDDIPF